MERFYFVTKHESFNNQALKSFQRLSHFHYNLLQQAQVVRVCITVITIQLNIKNDKLNLTVSVEIFPALFYNNVYHLVAICTCECLSIKKQSDEQHRQT